MNQELFYDNYRKFKESDESIKLCINTILKFEEFLGKFVEESSIQDINRYSNYLIDHNLNMYNNYIHLARYYYYIDYKEHYIHMTKYFNSLGVLENIVDRISLFSDTATKTNIIKELKLPEFGRSSDDLPKSTEAFMNVLQKHLDKASCDKILAGNNHRIPPESFNSEKEYYNKSLSLKDYLSERHQRKVQELQDHLDQNKVWFEQIITKEAIDFVKNNQEILSGVLDNDKLYITKIPYDIKNFIEAKDATLKKYYACHCTFVRENIKNNTADIPKEWCNCSAGFAKFPFEVILDQPLNVSLLNTPLDGDNFCRFEIDLTDVKYKKKPM